ncbi:nitroreductase family protein [Coprobacter sp.]
MKTIEDVLLKRTSVRRYEREKIEPEKLDLIYQAIASTPTSYNGQQYSVIAVDDQEKKELLYEIIGQKQIKTSAIFLVFCVDFNKISVLAQAKKVEVPRIQDKMDGVIVGLLDAALAMQNAVIAAQSLGLGSCCIGYTRTANPARVAEVLQLPQGVFVACGLSIGYPRECPDLKPKQPLSVLIHKNHYRTDDMTDDMLAYDRTICEYNGCRAGTKTDNDWCVHMLDYYREALKYDMEGYLKTQGFDLNFK